MQKFWNRLSLAWKMQMPSLLLLGLSVLIVVGVLRMSDHLADAAQNNKVLLDTASQLRAFRITAELFRESRINEDEYRRSVDVLVNDLSGTLDNSSLQSIDQLLMSYRSLIQKNRDIAAQMDALIDKSYGISNSYIKKVSAKLADEKTRESVSKLERLVIVGANINTTSNLTLKSMFRDMRVDLVNKGKLLKYLDELSANTKRDIESLKGTPFADMPRESAKTHVAIKQLVDEYIANVKLQESDEQKINSEFRTLMRNTDDNILSLNQKVFTGVTGDFELYSILFVLLTLVIILLNVVLARGIARPVLAGARHLAKVAETGDLTIEVEEHYRLRGDESGRLSRAIQSVIASQRNQSELAMRIAEGDWNVEIPVRSGNDELGNALSSMVRQMNETLSAIREAGAQVNSGSAQIESASQSLSQGATDSAASMEEITASMEDISNQAKKNADNSQQANQLTSLALNSAEQGNQRMTSMVSAMEEINNSSQRIAKIIKVIDDIAFQTNLLALNAAVEAARAGRHGKGFAVVAEEVRNLASRSAKAARETADLIDVSNSNVTNGTNIANQTSQTLEEIVARIGKVAELVNEIAAASNEQAEGVSQINVGLSRIDAVTVQNTSNAEETAAAAKDLSAQARALQELLLHFNLKDVVMVAPEVHRIPHATRRVLPEISGAW